ncbi:acid protease [Lindgomyces ingoldianus]|uniref:Acid protease n=1 Tax=Lindgomyces ingoldianus TaxID=673940 RepID=A0ACB6QQF6_9PLEO|nr:acid protease [Lindgomyces ingoldianus]KAF2468803.1 acid protease [Lindgomyces ingoldianus]
MFFQPRAENETTIPVPKVLTTGGFDGNDGQWTSFIFNIGSDDNGQGGQDFRLLISTSSQMTVIPMQAEWCTVPTEDECAKARGIQNFQSKQSRGFDSVAAKTWKQYGLYDIPLKSFLNIEWTPDSKVNGSYGLANVGIGPTSPQSLMLPSELVAQVNSKDLFMGSFGLSNSAINPGNGPIAPFLVNFNGSSIPSQSYSYTAGASYHLGNNSKGVPGSAILGGRDESRYTTEGTSIPFPNAGNQTLVVGVQDINFRPDHDIDSNEYSLMNGTQGFFAVVDSNLPYLFLPNTICDRFKESFQLDYDSKANMYWVSESAHDYNTRQNATVSFKIGKDTNSKQFTSIVLPYAALDLSAGFPLNGYNNNTGRRFFPMKQSSTGVFVLGRSFLQEAYLTVDYERQNFSLAPAYFSDPMPPTRIQPILSTNYVAPKESPSNSPSGGGGGGLAPGTVAGIVVGIVVAFLLGALVAFLFWKKKHKQKAAEQKAAEIDTVDAGNEIKHRRVSELDGEPPGSPKPDGGYYGRDQKDGVIPFPPLHEAVEMDSPPAELYSPPIESGGFSSLSGQTEGTDYFGAGGAPRRRGATRESSGKNTPAIPENRVHELPGDDGKFMIQGEHFEEVLSPNQSPGHSRGPSEATAQTGIDTVVSAPDADAPVRRPSQHIRGPSDAPTESTAVSEPTAEQREAWAQDTGPRRPLSE